MTDQPTDRSKDGHKGKLYFQKQVSKDLVMQNTIHFGNEKKTFQIVCLRKKTPPKFYPYKNKCYEGPLEVKLEIMTYDLPHIPKLSK